MAAALYNKLTSSTDAHSAGTYVGSNAEPEDVIIETKFRTPDFFELMEREGMYIRQNRTTKLVPDMVEKADIVISMAEEPFIPDFLRENKRVVWWNVENPAFATHEVSERTYCQIKGLVEKMIVDSSDSARALS